MNVFTDSFSRAHEWYKKYDRPISSISLVGGFVFDALTLKRVDMFWENFWILVHLLVVAVAILLINVDYNLVRSSDVRDKYNFWLVNILQFTFGGLLSVFLVFYFRSSTLAESWPFLLFLALAFFANERFKKHYEKIVFQISLFYLSIFCISIYLVPVVVHAINVWVFLLSGLVSLAVLWLFLVLLRKVAKENFKKSRGMLRASITSIFLAMNIFYFTNLIPPIPLSLKDAGMYHMITRDLAGNYILESEHKGFWSFLELTQDIHLKPGDPVYAYSAVFSPVSLSTRIIHVWQYWDNSRKKWITRSVIPLEVSGGREEGFRTYSVKNDLSAGRWRVDVTNTRGQVIGRINFKITNI